MALSNEELDFLMQPGRIRTAHLSEEARDFRDKYLKGIYKENRLQRDYLKRKADMNGERLAPVKYCDWNSDEEFREWLQVDRRERNKILDEVLADDNWLWNLALKYYPDNPEIVYADKEAERNWKRNELPKKKQYETD